MPEKFKADFDTWAKDVPLAGPWGLDITIDFDDVDHETVKRETRKLIKLLNEHWKS